jgi:cytochrome c oxidase assembly protein subunit 15
MLWIALGLLKPSQHKVSPGKLWHGWIALGFVVVTMIWGAFVAGLHAGEAYNTWPLMDGDILPAAAFTILPKWLNLFENLALVQFIHRWLAPTTMLVILAWVLRMNASGKAQKKWLHALASMALLQVALGLATLLTHVNIALATLHQAGAITLLTLLLINLFQIKRPA